MMRRFRFPIAVALTSLALVLVLGGVAALTVRSAMANAPWFGGPGFEGHAFGGPWSGPSGHEMQLPPELQGLHDLPPAERFAHFTGVQLSLKDKDNKPLTVNVTPGTVSAASAASLTLAANDGSTKTYTLNDQTMVRGRPIRGGTQATQSTPALANGDMVVVVTLDGTTAARAILNGGKEGFGPRGFGH